MSEPLAWAETFDCETIRAITARNGLQMETGQPSVHDIAFHFYVSHIPGATIPASRFNSLLEKMFHQQPLSEIGLSFLDKLGLTELKRLAIKEITYEAFVAGLDPALIAEEDARKEAFHQADRERSERERERALRATAALRKAANERAVRSARAAALAAEARKAAELIRAEQHQAWAAQRERNRNDADAAYASKISQTGAASPSVAEIAGHFRLGDNSAAVTSPLSNILGALYKGQPLSDGYLNYLKLKGFAGLYRFATGQTSYEGYIVEIEAAIAEEQARKREAENLRLKRELAEAARRARENDPAHKLRVKYGTLRFEPHLMTRLMTILEHVDKGDRLTDEDLVWLATSGKACFTEKLQIAHHRNAAEFYARAYRLTQNPWDAINASSHYRKCHEPNSASGLLQSVPMKSFKSPKLRAARCTALGGALRDLGQRAAALELAKEAHRLQPKDYRPCTLQGALYMELGEYALGNDWYARAEKLGASSKSIDAELRTIFLRADEPARKGMRAALLAQDAERYSWVNDDPQRQKRPRPPS